MPSTPHLPVAPPASGFHSPDRPRWEDYARCVHCGLCLNACPTFRVLGEEMDSPRGRIYQIAQADAGRLPLEGAMQLHLDRCLDCRACETACPSGVEYGKILEAARAELESQRPRPAWVRWLRRHAFGQVMPSPGWLRFYARWLWLYQRSGMQSLARASGLLRSLGLAGAESLAPAISNRFFYSAWGRPFPAFGSQRAQVGMLAGCIQNVAFAGMNRATLRVLQHNGCAVTIPAAQTCCGALHVHAGRRDEARRLARQNIAAFEALPCDAIISNSAGCGAALKEYPELLAGDPAWQARAAAFAARLRDVTEFLAELGLRPEGLQPLALTVTYQDPCHLAHGQGIRAAPRQLLEAIPQLRLRELPRSDQCCGSAGIYNLLQPGIAGRLLDDRMEAFDSTGADLLVTANPGCMLQLQAGLRRHRRNARVLHVVELLDQAYTHSNSPCF